MNTLVSEKGGDESEKLSGWERKEKPSNIRRENK